MAWNEDSDAHLEPSARVIPLGHDDTAYVQARTAILSCGHLDGG
jgi:hypothetical protein